MSFHIRFMPSGRGKARCPADPDYLHGKSLSIANPASRSCRITLPYPAPECGLYVVDCDDCHLTLGIISVGRPDDPTDITVNCKSIDESH